MLSLRSTCAYLRVIVCQQIASHATKNSGRAASGRSGGGWHLVRPEAVGTDFRLATHPRGWHAIYYVLSLPLVSDTLISFIFTVRDFPIDKAKLYRDPADEQLPANQRQIAALNRAEHGYPAQYCLLFSIVRATNCLTSGEVDKSTRWLYAKIAHGQYSFKTRMVSAAEPDWTAPTDDSDEVAGSDLICPLSNSFHEQQQVKLALYTYWRDSRGFHDQKVGTTRVHFGDGIALNRVVKKEFSLDEGGQVQVQYAVFDRKVLGEVLFPKIKSEQHRQEIFKFTKWKNRQAAREWKLGVANNAIATSLGPQPDTPSSPARKVV